MTKKKFTKRYLEEDFIKGIEIPYAEGTQQAEGYKEAAKRLADALFGDKRLPPKYRKIRDNRLKPLPVKSTNTSNLSDEEMKELVKKAREERDETADIIDDAGNKIEGANDNEHKDNVSKDDIEAANKSNARLQKISDFWDDKNLGNLEKDKTHRLSAKEVRNQIDQAKRNAWIKNNDYRTLSINEITNNLIRTIKNQVRYQRDSDWSHYNQRAHDLGYVSPGRFTDDKYNKPKVVFYFDVSSSWADDAKKIAIGHRVEESLKKLMEEGLIDLRCLYFGDEVYDQFTSGGGNAPGVPTAHAAELLAHKELDNVIIMTDSDVVAKDFVRVPGYAWLLFYDNFSKSLINKVSGKNGTSVFMIKHD